MLHARFVPDSDPIISSTLVSMEEVATAISKSVPAAYLAAVVLALSRSLRCFEPTLIELAAVSKVYQQEDIANID